MDELEKQKRDAMYAWILAKLDDLGAAMDRALGYPSSSLDPAPSPASVVAVSSTPATASDGAQKVFDEMPPHREASSGGVLRVSVSHVLYPVTKEVLHQLFDPYGAEKVQVLTVATHVEVLISFQSCHHAVRAREALHGRYIWDGCCQLDIQQVLEKPMGISTGTPATCSTTCPSHTTSMLTAAASSSATIVDTEPPASCSTKCPSDSNDVAIAATMSTPVAITVVDDSIASGVPEAAIALATEMRAKCSMSVLGVTTGSNGVTTMSPPLLSAFKEVPMPTEISPKLLAAIKLDNPMPTMCLKVCSNHDNGAHLDVAWPVAGEICNLSPGLSIHASRLPPGPPWEVAATLCEARGLCGPPDPWHHIRKPRADISGTFIFDPGIVFLHEYTLNTMSLSEGSPICRKVFDERYKDRVLLLISLWPLSSRGVTVCKGHKLRSPPECQSTTTKVGSCCLLGFLVSSLFLHAFCHPAAKEFCPSCSYVKGSRILHSRKIVHLECNIYTQISFTENSITRRTPCSCYVLPGTGSDKLERSLLYVQRLVGNKELHTDGSEEVVVWAFLYPMDTNNRTRLISSECYEISPCQVFSIKQHMTRFPAEISSQALAIRWYFGSARWSIVNTEKCLQSMLICRSRKLVITIGKIQNVDLKLACILIVVLKISCNVLLYYKQGVASPRKHMAIMNGASQPVGHPRCQVQEYTYTFRLRFRSSMVCQSLARPALQVAEHWQLLSFSQFVLYFLEGSGVCSGDILGRVVGDSLDETEMTLNNNTNRALQDLPVHHDHFVLNMHLDHHLKKSIAMILEEAMFHGNLSMCEDVPVSDNAEIEVPWDPGGGTLFLYWLELLAHLYRLGGKPNLKRRRMSRSCIGPDHSRAMGQGGCCPAHAVGYKGGSSRSAGEDRAEQKQLVFLLGSFPSQESPAVLATLSRFLAIPSLNSLHSIQFATEILYPLPGTQQRGWGWP